ncbi:hypothetical protein H0X48_03595 [Candidatus Dependentiae bacterium]|nr:hypothetical protein [Candidatus Dependentiae bacterium]
MKKITLFLLLLPGCLMLIENCTCLPITKTSNPSGNEWSYFHNDIVQTKHYQTKITPVTVQVHGTLPPLISKLVHALDSPLGLVPALTQGNKYYLGRIPYLLYHTDPQDFPLKTSYLFGWSGRLNFQARKEAAHELYKVLKELPHPITLITHSHGGNVALNLALIVQEYDDTTFFIDRLVLLAAPVQAATAHLVKSPIFKRVISLYSSKDWTQVIDPQRLYSISRSSNIPVPFFSQRIYPASDNLIQACILINRRSPTHIEFLSPNFFKTLPVVLEILTQSADKAHLASQQSHFNISIPRCLYCQSYKVSYKKI